MTPPAGTAHRPPFPVGWFAVAALDEVLIPGPADGWEGDNLPDDEEE